MIKKQQMESLPDIFPKDIKKKIINNTNDLNDVSFLTITSVNAHHIIRWDPILETFILYLMLDDKFNESDKFNIDNIETLVGHLIIYLIQDVDMNEKIRFRLSINKSYCEDYNFQLEDYCDINDNKLNFTTIKFLRNMIKDYLYLLKYEKREDLTKRDNMFYKTWKKNNGFRFQI